MLQMTILHEKNNGEEVTITEINDGEKVLAKFEDGLIDVDVCVPYIGQDILVSHVHENEDDSYTSIATLESVDIDGNSGVKYVKYSPKSKK